MRSPNTPIAGGQFVVFSINNQQYTLPIDEVVEIIRMQTITNVPGTADYIMGMINLRGKIIPIISLRERFSMPMTSFNSKTRIIIVQNDGEHIGLLVDEVKMVSHVQPTEVEATPDIFNQIDKDCILAFAKLELDLIGILNMKKVLFPDGEGRE